MKLRHAEPEDLERVVEIYNASIPTRLSSADLEPVSVESRRAWFESHTPDRRPLLVLEEDGVILGWIGLKNHYDRAGYDKTAEVAVYIDQDDLGRGLGQRLVREIIALAPSLGITTLLAICFADNVPSVRLFENFGFVQWGFYPGIAELDGRPYDVVHLGLKITG